MDLKEARRIKIESERIIKKSGGRVCDWLPIIDPNKSLRTEEDIVNRSLVLNALSMIYFKAPIGIVRDWIHSNNLNSSLSNKEKALLDKDNRDLEEQELIDLFWYIEALWALMWVGNLIDDIPFDKPVEDYMASLTPDLQNNEDGSKFMKNMKIREQEEIYKKLDLYFRIHWFTEDSRINNYPTGKIDPDIIIERRKALEWVLDKDLDWDDIPLNT